MKRKLVFMLAVLIIACTLLPALSLERVQPVNDAQYPPVDIYENRGKGYGSKAQQNGYGAAMDTGLRPVERWPAG